MSDINDDDIRALQREAGEADDLAMVAICKVATGEDPDAATGARRMSQAEAREECARVIAEAAAQAD